MKLLVICSGSIAIKKTFELIRFLKKENVEIEFLITRSGLSIIKSKKIKTFGNYKVYTDDDFFDNNSMLHIELSRKTDAIIVYPASANIMAKFANGIADDLATSTLLASNKQIFIAPAMNVEMWNNNASQTNVRNLKKMGVNFIGPIHGNLACGEIGFGRISNAESIANELLIYLKSKKLLKGITGIVTSGPTIEPIDSIRYVSNYSSGKQGYAIAKILSLMGANISLISGPTNLDKPLGVKIINVKSAKEMNQATMDLLPVDLAICAAAVSDFKPDQFTFNKKKKEELKSITLRKNPDILYNLGSSSHKRRPRLLIGFAADTSNIKIKAKAKLIEKKCDWILANRISRKNPVFGSEKNSVYYITKNSYEDWRNMTKLEIAKKLNSKIIDFFTKTNETVN